MSSVYQALIIEDEPLAQKVLEKYINEHPALEIAAICADALEAQQFLNTRGIDIIFLDINLPRLSGINFLKTLSHPPLIIFTTAYPEYAVEGFELDAVDYLVKPFSFERFLKAVNKALALLNKQVTQSNAGQAFRNDSIFLKSEKKVYKINLEDILYIEAIGDYIKVITGSKQYVVNGTLKSLQEELPPAQFLRVHKSYIIDRNKIVFFEGNYVKVSDKEIPIGASYRDDIYLKLKERKL